MKAKEVKAQQRQRAQEQLLAQVQPAGAQVTRDPSRVLSATAAAKARLEASKNEQRQSRDSAFILHVAHRAAPSWMAAR